MRFASFLRTSGMALTVLSVMACSNDSSTDSGSDSAAGMRGTLDGTSWSASLSAQGTRQGTVLVIAGQDNQVRQVRINLLNAEGPGEYTLGGTADNPNTGQIILGLGQNDTYATSLGRGTGTVKLTTLTATQAIGTFSFTGKNIPGAEKAITNGSFNVTLQ